MSRWPRGQVLGAGLLAAVAVALWLAASRYGIEWLNSGLAAVLATAGIAAAFFRSVRAVPWDLTERATRLDQALESLARVLAEQWRSEERARRLDDPWPLPVEWAVTATARALMANPAAISGRPTSDPPALAGTIDHVAEVFLSGPAHCRLVILGAPGAGKSMIGLRLLLDLLDQRRPRDPVPVLLPASTWNPRHTSLDDWVADEVARRYPDLAATAEVVGGATRSAARALVGTGAIFPILDGLDEMSEPHVRHAMEELARAVGRGRRLLVTCRTDRYAHIVRERGPLPRTPVVELLPLRDEDVVSYLSEATANGQGDRWRDVEEALRTGQPEGVRQALSTPLGVWLARTVYRSPGTDPGELLTIARAGGQDGVMTHLLRQLVTAAYTSPNLAYLRRPPSQAAWIEQRLRNLARELNRLGLKEIAFEDSFRLLPMPLVVMAGTALFGSLSVLCIGLAAMWVAGPGVGGHLILTNFLALCGAAVISALPWFDRFSRPTGGMAFWPARATATTAASAWATGVTLTLTTQEVRPEAPAFAVGVAGSITTTIVARLFLRFVIRRPDPTKAVNALGHYRTRRRAALEISLVGGFSYGLWLGAILSAGGRGPQAFGIGLAAGTLAGLAAVIPLTGYGMFLVARLGLAAKGLFPVRVLRFLDEAHRRGVLRQSGGLYEFRHALLQEALARR